jgi:hypothetical protein
MNEQEAIAPTLFRELPCLRDSGHRGMGRPNHRLTYQGRVHPRFFTGGQMRILTVAELQALRDEAISILQSPNPDLPRLAEIEEMIEESAKLAEAQAKGFTVVPDAGAA